MNVLAAEFALGLLDEAAAGTAAQREREDPEFAAMVADWRERAARWIEELPAEPVDGAIWTRVQLALGHGAPAATAISQPAQSGLWRAAALLAMAACVVLAVVLGVTLTSRGALPPPDQPAATDKRANVAQIADAKGAPLLSAVYQPGSGTLTMRVSNIAASDRAPELWVMDSAGKPHSLGLIDKGQSVSLKLSDDLRQLLVDGAIMAITLEEREGAPHAAPEGEILGTAKLSTI